MPYFDEIAGKEMDKQMSQSFDLLLGRVTMISLPLTGQNVKMTG